MSRPRTESSQSVTAESANDVTPLYYCDRNVSSENNTKKAERSLYIASAVTAIFIAVELVGGYLANSLAVMTDAGHMASDLLSFFISIVAIKLARKKATKRFPYGYYRAEVLGAFISVLMIWLLTGILVYAAIRRLIHQDFDVQEDLMLVTAGIGVVFNLIMGGILYLGKAPHAHFGVQHHHHHHHKSKTYPTDAESGMKAFETNVSEKSKCDKNNNNKCNIINKASFEKANINLRAAFIHVLGDLVQSLGVLAAAVILKMSGWLLADPICTFLFSILVIITTYTVARDAVMVLMEATPRHISMKKLRDDLISIEGVQGVHSLRVWSLTMDKAAVSVHLDTGKGYDSNHIVHEANEKLKHIHGIKFITIQVQCICSRTVSPSSFSSISSVDKEKDVK